MGQFSEWNKKQSKFLQIQPGETVEVVWTGKAEKVKTQYGEGWEFEFETPDGNKIYTIKNGAIVAKFDDFVAGDKLRIKKNPKDVRPSLELSKI